MTTILAHHISHVRPRRIKLSRKENVFVSPSKRPRTRKLGMAEFFKICLTYDSSWIKPGKPWEKS